MLPPSYACQLQIALSCPSLVRSWLTPTPPKRTSMGSYKLLAGERRRPQDVDGLTMLLPCQGRPPQLYDGDHLDPQKLGAISRRVAPRR